jgi:hypothetical protein
VDTIDDTLATADKEWRAYGVRRADREALAADLRLDLESAAADDVTPAQLLGADLRGFARRLADEAGLRRMPPEYPLVVGTALAGAAAGAAAGLLVLVLMFPIFVRMVDMPRTWQVPVQVVVGVYYGIPAVIVVAGAVTAVRVHLRKVPRIRSTARAMSLLLPVAGLLITPVTMGFAFLTGYSTAPHVVLVELLLVLTAFTGATVLARRWALREPAQGAAVSLA